MRLTPSNPDESVSPVRRFQPYPIRRDLTNADYLWWTRFLQASERWSAERIRRHQLRKLRWILQHAYQNTAGYRRLFEQAGARPEDLRELEDVRRFPVVTREDRMGRRVERVGFAWERGRLGMLRATEPTK